MTVDQIPTIAYAQDFKYETHILEFSTCYALSHPQRFTKSDEEINLVRTTASLPRYVRGLSAFWSDARPHANQMGLLHALALV